MPQSAPEPVDPAFPDRVMAEMNDRAARSAPLASAYAGSEADAAKRVGLYRQQMPPSDRIHSIVTEGGQGPERHSRPAASCSATYGP